MSNRSYVVGLPVVIEVGEDGVVRVEVDLSEAGQAIREQAGEAGSFSDDPDADPALYSDDEVEADGNLVDTVRDDHLHDLVSAPIEVRWS